MRVLIVGCGISGLYAAYSLAKNGITVDLVSPEIPERSQSVMAAGGINAAIDTMGENDSCELHIEDTLRAGKGIEDRAFVEGLCRSAPEIISELSDMGVMFARGGQGQLLCRAFGGQSRKRTVYAGASTGKQIVTALTSRLRKYQSEGTVRHLLQHRFLGGLIENGVCCGGLFLDERDNSVRAITADAVIIASGGQNRLFGKTTGSVLCDGFAAAKLFTQGVRLRNLEFIQYHPTTIETSAKRMLISEAARGEGGRLFYYHDDGSKCYFLEDKYGEKGNLMSRDIVSKEMYDTGKDIYLDISFLGKKVIREKLPEICDLCLEYIGVDVSKEAIPVAPSVHFFMGGIAVDPDHETNIQRLFAVGECASAYHGANRLGGNSMLAAVYGAKKAAEKIAGLSPLTLSEETSRHFEAERETLSAEISRTAESRSKYPAVYFMEEIAKIMRTDLGIVRDEASLREGLDSLKFYADSVRRISFDGTLTPYESFALPSLLILAEAILRSALFRKESRGAHFRTDYPDTDDRFRFPTLVSYENGEIVLRGDGK